MSTPMEHLQRLLNAVNAVTAYYRHGNRVPHARLEALSERQLEAEAYIKAQKEDKS